ncbi:MAG: hypothetical protein V2I47_13235 [Bacteroidales bacterium]|jgi:hypothetical protein|nr:hypothetical protein [Bacteroidales bacterium]
MHSGSKLRPDFSPGGIGQPVVILVVFCFAWLLFGITYAFSLLALIYGVYALISLTYLRRTENLWYIAPFVFQCSMVLFLLLAPEIGIFAIPRSSFAPMILLMIVLTAVLIYIMFTKKLKWRGREILELAARQVNETSNGFTERPRPIDKIEFNTTEFRGFVLFIKSRLIFWTIEEQDRYVFVTISMGEEYRLPLGFSSDYSENTWVSVDKEGNVSAQISKKDYMKYKETLAFDQLTDALGNLFIDYFERYKRGEGDRIMYELNAARSNPFS